MKSFEQFRNQELNNLFGNYVITTEENLDRTRREAMEVLAESIVVGTDISGYKQAGWTYIEKMASDGGVADPLNVESSIAGRIKGKLTATTDQYNHHLAHFASAAIADHKREFLQRKKMETWRGFLRFQMSKIGNFLKQV